MTTTKLRSLALAAALGLAAPATVLAGDKAGDPAAYWKTMDADGDGKVSPAEHEAAAKQKFETMDANKDGKVNAEEMTAAHDKAGKKARPGGMSAAEKIKKLDTDGDGALSAEEHATGAKSMFGMMDTDKDGFVTRAELEAGHKAMMKKDGAKESKEGAKGATK